MNLKTDMLLTELVVKEGDEVNIYFDKKPLNAPNRVLQWEEIKTKFRGQHF